jgi:hypothetical protein
VEDVKQHRFPWAVGRDHRDRPEVVLDPATSANVIALLARALVAVVRAVEEPADDR